MNSAHHPEVPFFLRCFAPGMPFTSKELVNKGRKTERRHLLLIGEKGSGFMEGMRLDSHLFLEPTRENKLPLKSLHFIELKKIHEVVKDKNK